MVCMIMCISILVLAGISASSLGSFFGVDAQGLPSKPSYLYMVLRSAFPAPPPPPMVSPPLTPPMICFKSANSHRDQPRQGRHPRNCRRFWSRKASILVTVVTFGPSCCRRASKVPTVTGIGMVLIAILRTVLTFDPSCCRRASDVSTDYKCIIFPPSELSSLLAPYVFVALQMYRQINNHRYKPSIEP